MIKYGIIDLSKRRYQIKNYQQFYNNHHFELDSIEIPHNSINQLIDELVGAANDFDSAEITLKNAFEKEKLFTFELIPSLKTFIGKLYEKMYVFLKYIFDIIFYTIIFTLYIYSMGFFI